MTSATVDAICSTYRPVRASSVPNPIDIGAIEAAQWMVALKKHVIYNISFFEGPTCTPPSSSDIHFFISEMTSATVDAICSTHRPVRASSVPNPIDIGAMEAVQGMVALKNTLFIIFIFSRAYVHPSQKVLSGIFEK